MTKLSSMWDVQARVSLGKGPSDTAAGKRLESSCVDLCTKILGVELTVCEFMSAKLKVYFVHILARIWQTPSKRGGVVGVPPKTCPGSLTLTSQ